MHTITVTRFFEAAHMLPDSPNLITKQCSNLHGHTYHVVVTAESVDNRRNGMVVDFRAIKDIIDRLDHTVILREDYIAILDAVNVIRENQGLSKQEGVSLEGNPTAENIASYLHKQILEAYPDLLDINVLVAEGYKDKDHTSYVGYRE
jgi:6-pyruvoyl tetrahydropterin synthase/QueD family protein